MEWFIKAKDAASDVWTSATIVLSEADETLGISEGIKQIDRELGVSERAKQLATDVNEALHITEGVQKADEFLHISEGIQKADEALGASEKISDLGQILEIKELVERMKMKKSPSELQLVVLGELLPEFLLHFNLPEEPYNKFVACPNIKRSSAILSAKSNCKIEFYEYYISLANILFFVIDGDKDLATIELQLLRAAAIFSSEELPKNCTCCVAVLCKQARGLLLPSVTPAAEFHFMKIQTCPLLAVIDEHNFQDTIEDLFSFINRDDEKTHIWKVVEKKQSDLHNTST